MKKQYSWPKNHWNWPVRINHKHAVRCGSMIWIGGQVDLNPQGQVQNPNNLALQTENSIRNLSAVIDDLNCEFSDLVTLLCFYVNNGSIDERDFLTSVADCLPLNCKTTVNAVPVPYLAYDGMMVEIEGFAMRRKNGEKIARAYSSAGDLSLLPAPFVEGIRCDAMIFVSGQYPIDASTGAICKGDIVHQTRTVADRIGKVLCDLGADFDDVVKINRWYAGASGVADFEAAALEFAGNFTEPGPAATGVPIPRHADEDVLIKISAIAMRGKDGSRLKKSHSWPESLWDWHVHLPYKHGLKCQDMIFLGGQVSLDRKGRAVHADNLPAQTHQAMQHIGTILNDLGADYDDVCKVMAVYQGDCVADDLHENLPIRSSYFSDPGPATTGVPLPALAYESMVIEIDIFAMLDSSAACSESS